MAINKMRVLFRLWARCLVSAIVIFGILQAVSGQDIKPDLFKQLEFRHIGPPGNRVSSVAGVPGDPRVYYIGASSGGVFKTTDGGANWSPIFDDQITLAIGSLAVAPSNPNIIWAGTGETWIRNNALYLPVGNGIYKSSDGGATWAHAGLEKTGRIGRIVIDPKDPNIVFAAAMGHCFGPQQERGVFRTTDGGKTWKRVLFVDDKTGCSDIAPDPKNPRVLYAGMWQTLAEQSGGPSSGLYLTRDRGETWKKLSGHGLPEPPVGKIGVAVAPSHPSRVYALIETGGGRTFRGMETGSGVLWTSNDAGENWQLVSHDLALAGRAAYYTRCAVAPDNPNEIFFLAAQFNVSRDGGKTSQSIGRELHGDHHDIWIDPSNGDRIIQSNDGGIGISVNRGKTWQQISPPIAQLYHVSVDNQIPYYVYGNEQDYPSQRGPSNSRLGREGIPRGLWHDVGGSEAGFAVADPADNNIIWSTGHPGGALDRYDVRTGHARAVEVAPDDVWGWPDADLRYRFQRTFPIVISPHDHNKVYIGSQFVHRTTDGGQSWRTISPDLTTNDKSQQQGQDSLTPMNSGSEDCVIFALSESPLKAGLIWAGTNDGLVQLTRDGGAHWTNVTPNIPNLPKLGSVSNIESSRYDPGTCYITVNFHERNDRNPYVYKTADYGQSWKSLSAGLSKSETYSANARCIREDPVRRGLLYLGTENGIFVSLNDGESWLPFRLNLPHVPVHWMVVQENFNDLVLATYGRGFQILDDVTALQQLTPEVLASDAHLFRPRPAYRFHAIKAPMTQSGDPSVGENPPYGASLQYYLKNPEKGGVRIDIRDERDQTVQTLEGPRERGINRVWWDLMSDLSKEPRLLTGVLGAPWVGVGERGWRPVPIRGGGRLAIMAPPGNYTVNLTVGEKVFSQKLTLKKDPHSAGSEKDIQSQTKLLSEIRDRVNSIADMINQLEWIRKQIYELAALSGSGKDAQSVKEAGQAFDRAIVAVEDALCPLRATGRGQDSTYRPSKLLNRLLGLAGSVASADFPPTSQQLEQSKMFGSLVEASRRQYDELLAKDFPSFNRLLKEKGMTPLILKGK